MEWRDGQNSPAEKKKNLSWVASKSASHAHTTAKKTLATPCGSAGLSQPEKTGKRAYVLMAISLKNT